MKTNKTGEAISLNGATVYPTRSIRRHVHPDASEVLAEVNGLHLAQLLGFDSGIAHSPEKLEAIYVGDKQVALTDVITLRWKEELTDKADS